MQIENVSEWLSEARELYEGGRESDAVDRKAAEDDNRFAYADDVNLEQWDKVAKRLRKKRPIVQWNRIPTFTQRIANESRKNKPSIKISRGDEAATAPTAIHLAARIRYIEYESNVDTARDVATKQQVTTGRAAMRVKTEWIPGTQKQRIRVEPIANQFSVVWDPGALEYDRSDASWCFVVTQITKDEHIRRFGKERTATQTDFADPDCGSWVNIGQSGDMIQIADYWFKKYETRTVPAQGAQPARTEKVAVVYSCVINGAEILEEPVEWLGSTIPIVPQWGEEAVVDGLRRTFSLIRNAKSPQRDLNLFVSNMDEQIGQMPKTPFLAPVGSIAANHEDDWANALNTPLHVLYWQQFQDPAEGGREYKRPERMTAEPPIQALLEGMNACIDAIKSSMGIYDAALGAKSNEQSGVAIERRKVQGEITNLHFADNAARTNKYLGEILVELIMKMERTGSYPVRTEDGKTHIVPMGVEHQDWKTGEAVTHDLSQGQYGVTVANGPSYDSQRQELRERDEALITANPDLMWVFGDQMFANDDAPGSEERADRMKRAINMKTPGLIQDKGNQPDPQAMQQQLQQMHQELQTTQAFAQDLHQKLEGKTLELANALKLKEMDLQFKREELAVTDQNAKLTIASKESIEQLEHDITILRDEHNHMRAALLLEQQQAHATETQQGQQEHESSESEAQRQAAADSQTQTQDFTAQQADADRQAAAQTQEKE